MWSLAVGSPNGAAVFGEVAVVSSNAHVVRGIDIDSGEVVWCNEHEPNAGEFRGGLVSAGPVVAMLTGDSIVGLSPSTGSELWRRPIDATEATLLGGDVLWVLDGSAARNALFVLNPMSGEEVAPPVERPVSLPSFGNLGAPLFTVDNFTLSAEQAAREGQLLDVSVSVDGSAVWTATVPGFVAAMIPGDEEPIVLVIDQTGGYGEFGDRGDRAETVLSAYALSGEAPLWQVELPGTPDLITHLADDTVVVPVGTTLHAFDALSGAERWVQELTSPGRGGSHNLPGTFRFVSSDTSAIGVAVGQAERPYRD